MTDTDAQAKIDLDHLRAWIGRNESTTDIAAAEPLARLAALLDHEDPPWRSGELVPLGHWLNFLPRARQSEIGEDGHPRRGGFLPPVPLPRRMWAGGRLTFEAPIPVGAALERRSTISDVVAKTGKTGSMVFVTVQHEIRVAGQVAVREQQDIVYRELTQAKPASPAPAAAPLPAGQGLSECTVERLLDEVQLFRFSALTFNAHRIHYDRDYCRNVEGYPGLVVQGPFIATLLMDHFLRSTKNAQVAHFSFRAHAPLYVGAPVSLCLRATPGGADLWTVDSQQRVSMTAAVQTQRV
jgi:3-methylfumaryl-CoA hydratase